MLNKFNSYILAMPSTLTNQFSAIILIRFISLMLLRTMFYRRRIATGEILKLMNRLSIHIPLSDRHLSAASMRELISIPFLISAFHRNHFSYLYNIKKRNDRSFDRFSWINLIVKKCSESSCLPLTLEHTFNSYLSVRLWMPYHSKSPISKIIVHWWPRQLYSFVMAINAFPSTTIGAETCEK